MKIVLVPGPRNEELVQEILQKKLEFKEDEEAWVDYVTDFVWLGDE